MAFSAVLDLRRSTASSAISADDWCDVRQRPHGEVGGARAGVHGHAGRSDAASHARSAGDYQVITNVADADAPPCSVDDRVMLAQGLDMAADSDGAVAGGDLHVGVTR